MTILRGCPLYLVHLPLFRSLLRHLPFWYVAVYRLCVRVSGVPVCGMSGCERPDIPQTCTPDTPTHRRHTATYQKGK
jgi:hypothetical protein